MNSSSPRHSTALRRRCKSPSTQAVRTSASDVHRRASASVSGGMLLPYKRAYCAPGRWEEDVSGFAVWSAPALSPLSLDGDSLATSYSPWPSGLQSSCELDRIRRLRFWDSTASAGCLSCPRMTAQLCCSGMVWRLVPSFASSVVVSKAALMSLFTLNSM